MRWRWRRQQWKRYAHVQLLGRVCRQSGSESRNGLKAVKSTAIAEMLIKMRLTLSVKYALPHLCEHFSLRFQFYQHF